jgi:enoyl-CoA hydratase/carnithine racemase
MTNPRITTETRDRVLLIGLNRPDKLNAFDEQMLQELSAAYCLLGDDPELRVGVLFARGKHFCAGLDLGSVWPALEARGPELLAGGGKYDPLGVWGPSVPKPVVMAVHGVAFTISIELALVADIVVAADDARFRQLEVGRGIVPFGGATFRAPARVGWGNAMRFLLTAEEFGAAEAHRIGLVQEVVSVGEHLKRAVEIAEVIAAQAPAGVQATLANARIARSAGEAEAVEHLRSVLPGILSSEDAVEGLQSFIERRQAQFTGR